MLLWCGYSNAYQKMLTLYNLTWVNTGQVQCLNWFRNDWLYRALAYVTVKPGLLRRMGSTNVSVLVSGEDQVFSDDNLTIVNGEEDNIYSTPHAVSDLPKSIILLMAICIGAVFNLLVIWSIVKQQRLHKAPYYFIGNLAAADFLRSVICLPVILETAMQRSEWQHGDSGCKALAFSSTFLIFGAVFSLFILALDRHIAVVHSHFHTQRFHGPTCCLTMLIAWIVSFFLAFPPIFGLGTYDYDPIQAQCTFKHLYYADNDTLGFTAIFVVINVLTGFVYFRIFCFLRSRRRMAPIMYSPARSATWAFFVHRADPVALNNLPNPNTQPLAVMPHLNLINNPQMQPILVTRNLRENVRIQCNQHLTRINFCITLVYYVLWIPYVVLCFWYMFDIHRQVSWFMATIATWLTYVQVGTLPTIYLFCHKPLREAVQKPWISPTFSGYRAPAHRIDTWNGQPPTQIMWSFVRAYSVYCDFAVYGDLD